MSLLKVAVLTGVFAGLLSVNYTALAWSSAVTRAPAQTLLVAAADTLVLSYFVVSSRWTGEREWGTVFALLYGMVYVLTAIETVYLGSLLSVSDTLGLLANGAVTSAVFAGALIVVWGRRPPLASFGDKRLQMPGREWVWKIAVSAGSYLGFFILFGLAVYAPLGRAFDPVAYAQEQSTAAGAATLVFPVELLRGALWSLLALPAILALPFSWKKTGLIVGLLMAVPLSMTLFMGTTMAIGLQVAHAAEIFGENLVFGLALVWLLKVHSRLVTVA